MKGRLKRIRKEFHIKNQQEFADALELPLSNISSYESGRRTPSDAVISLICTKYGIRREWLLTGEEPMKQSTTRDIQIEKFVGEALSGESDNFKKRLISVLANLTADEWELLEQKAKELVGMNDE